MKKWILITLSVFLLSKAAFAQNQNISNGNLFDGEPYLAINPNDAEHMVVGWMGFVQFNAIAIRTRATFDAGQSWSETVSIPHAQAFFTSADPCLDFDDQGNVYLSYVDYNAFLDSGAVYIAKSIDGGLSWNSPVEVIDAYADGEQYPIDRPWMSIDRSGGPQNGNIYITTMSPKAFGPVFPPYHPYVTISTDGGESFEPWQYLDTAGWLSGNIISQPMPSNVVSADGTFHAVYPSFVLTQSLLPKYFIASSTDGGGSFDYHEVHATSETLQDSLAKTGYLLRANPADDNHLAFFYLGVTHGDADIFMKESADAGVTWSDELRLNDDPIANNRMQDLVWADFDIDGGLVVSWRDRRNASDSTYTVATEIWATYRDSDSLDFSPNFRIADQSVPHDSILTGSGNDFMCIKLANDTLNAVWGDTRDGRLNIWFQRMSADGVITSIQELSSEVRPTFSIYPNPVAELLTIESEGLSRVRVIDTLGREVLNQADFKNARRVQLDVSSLPQGEFYIEVSNEQGRSTEKFIKE